MRCCHLVVLLLVGAWGAVADAQPLRPTTPPPPTTPPAFGGPAPATPAPAGGYLGLTADTAVSGGGVEVLTIEPGGPAAKASMRTGDIIQRVNGQPVRTVDELGAQMVRHRSGATVRFEVRRGLSLLEMIATLTTRPAAARPPASAPATGARTALLGVVTLPIDVVTAERLGLAVQRGALVDQVAPGTPAQVARIPLGAVIVAVDETRINSPADLRTAIAKRGPGATVTIQYYEGTAIRGVRLTLAAAGSSAIVSRPPVGDDVRKALGDELRSMRQQLSEMQKRIEELERLLAAP